MQKRAGGLSKGFGLMIIQTFEPLSLYAPMEALGFEHFAKQVGEDEFHIYFYRVQEKETAEVTPFRPLFFH